MKRINLRGIVLEMYDSIDEMPITRFQEYNRFLLIDSGIGSDVESISKHIAKVNRFIDQDQKENAKQELNNYFQNLLFVIEHTSPEMSAFCALIASVNGHPYNDLSEEGVQRLKSRLSKKGLTIGKVRQFLNEIKKKSKPNFWPFSQKAKADQIASISDN